MQQTTTHIPDDLQQAINEIYLWVKEGYPEHKDFYIGVGLCSNIDWVTKWCSVDINKYFFGEDEYPFNTNYLEYNAELNKYTNPKRLAWLQKHQTVE